jgi:peptidoglycan/LPS O-acetylase OafA/YrhL
MQSRPPIPALTGLRFVAAFIVLIGHSVTFLLTFPGDVLPTWERYLHFLGGLGMPLFFVLSGFVIHYNYSEPIEIGGWPNVYNFFVARFARLYPLYISCIAFDLIFKYSYVQLPASTAQALPYYVTLTQSWFYAPSQ